MAIFTKHELYLFTRRLYRLMKNHPENFQLRKMNGRSGCYHFKECDCWSCKKQISKPNFIELDYRANVIESLIHESIHHWYPDWNEKQVERLESNIINQLSVQQIKNIIKKFARIL